MRSTHDIKICRTLGFNRSEMLVAVTLRSL
jgi:hypothetical protein